MSDGYRNYGPQVSESPEPTSSGGAFSGEDRSYESVVIQADAPVIDWEMNLRSQVGSDYGLRRSSQRRLTTCFLGGDFLERSDSGGSFVQQPASVGNQNKLVLLAADALVNGWDLRVEYSGTTTAGQNLLTFPAPPASGTRTDLVILESWRALVRAAPSTANKSATSLILRNGNVKAPDAVNLSDDLIDPNYGVESNARVQIQYRLRVISGVNLASYMDGIDDPTVVAYSVSNFSGPGADGSPTVYTYSSVGDDKGLWGAGLGNAVSAGILGTADGRMYATPVCAVMRRNSAAFSRSSNMNGGSLIVSGTSDRPDGLFSDQIVVSDIVDLRRACSSSYEEVMEKAFQQVLDNSMTTHGTVSGLGTVGTSFLYRDDVGAASSAPTGTTDAPGNPDGVRRYFGDRSVTETIVFLQSVTGSTLTFDISDIPSVNPSLAAAVPWNTASTTSVLQNAPAGTNIVEVVRLMMVNASGTFDLLDSLNPSGIFVTSMTYSDGVDGENTKVVITLSSPSTGPVYAEVAVEYPAGSGLSRNLLESFQLWAPSSLPAVWIDNSSWVSAPPSDGTRLIIPQGPTTAYDGSQWWNDAAHRELALRHRSVVVSAAFRSEFSSSAAITGNDQNAVVSTTGNNVLQVRTNPASGFTTVTVTSSASLPKSDPSITGSDTAAAVNTTGLNANKLRVRTNPGASFTDALVTAGASVTKTSIALSLYGAVSGLVAQVSGTNQLVLRSSTGYLEIDTVASGSGLSTVLGISAGGDVSTSVLGDLNLNLVSALPAISAIASVVGTNQIRITSTTGYIEVNADPPSTVNSALGFSLSGEFSGSDFVMIPERLTGDPVTIDDGVNAPYQSTDYTVNTAFTRLSLQFPTPPSQAVQVDYTAYRPPPPVSPSSAYNLFYQSRAMQALVPPAGTQTLPLTPRAFGRTMSVIVTGPGSPDDSFPFTAPGDQVPVGALPAPDFPESLLDGPADVYLSNFNINTGFMQLVPFIPYVPNPGDVTLFRDASDVVLDAEGRGFWPKSDSGSPPVYSPSIFAQELFFGRRHKVAYPVLMELKSDFPGVGQRGMLVLVVMAAWLEYDPECRIVLLPVAGEACAGVYRVRGNALSPRRPDY